MLLRHLTSTKPGVANTATSAPKRLARFDFRRPTVQPFPSTAKWFTDRDEPAPTSVWLCDESSGDLVDRIGSIDLTPAGSPLQNQRAVGFWDGASMYAKRGVELVTTATDSFDAAAGTSLDADDSVAILVVFRLLEKPASNKNLFGKRKGSGDFEGYELYVTATGQVQVAIDDGASTVFETIAEDHADGAWHAVLFRFSTSASEVELWSDLGGSGSTAVVSSPSEPTTVFKLGAQRIQGARAQFAYLVAWEGTVADSVDGDTLEKLFAHAREPSGLLTLFRTNTQTDVIANDATLGDFVGTYGETQLAIGYSSALSGNGFGFRCFGSHTNLATQSEELASGAPWTGSSVSIADDDSDSPAGWRNADEITQTGAGGHIYNAVTGLSGSTQYTASVWLRTKDGGHDVTIAARNAADSADIATANVSAVDGWARYSLTFTTDAGQTASNIRIYGGLVADTDKVVLVWGFQVNTGASAQPYVRTAASTATGGDERLSVANTDLVHLDPAAGEIRCVAVADEATTASSKSLVSARGDSSDEDRRTVTADQASGADAIVATVHDSAGAAQSWSGAQSDLDLSVEHEYRLRWDADAVLSDNSNAYADAVVDGTVEQEITSSWTAGTSDAEPLRIGTDVAAGAHWEGLIALVEVYDGPRALAAT